MINEYDAVGTFQVALDNVVSDKKLQPRTHPIDKDNVESLLNSDPASWPAILVSPPREDGKRVLVSGHHRLKAAHEMGLYSIKAREAEADLEVAYEQNLGHGLQLTMAERKNYAKLLRERHPSMLQGEIARRAHISESTLSNLLSNKEERGKQTLQVALDKKKDFQNTFNDFLDLIFMHGINSIEEKEMLETVVNYINIIDGHEASDQEIETGCQLVERLITILSTAISHFEIE